MSGNLRCDCKRAVLSLMLALSLLALIAVTVLPSAAAEPPGDGDPVSTSSSRDMRDLEDAIGERHVYYSPEVAGAYNPEADEQLEELCESVPDGLLPEFLSPEPGEETEFSATGEVETAGTGGWMPLTRPYDPSAAADVVYNVGTSWTDMDDNGRLHCFYDGMVRTDISQAPDPAGTRYEYLADNYHATYSEGAWSTPSNLTGVSGFEDSAQIFFGVDGDGYMHVIYSRWTWVRNPNTGLYQHEEENLFCRCMSPDGAWGVPRQLTAYAGCWGLVGAEFTMHGDRLYGTWLMVLNNETVPTSYRCQVGFIEGAYDDWGAVHEITQWDFSDDPGQQHPVYFPSIDVSDAGGEVTVVYSVSTMPGALYTSKIDIHGAVRDIAGAWSGPVNVSNAANNIQWIPIFVFYTENRGIATVFGIEITMITDAAHPERGNFYAIYQRGGTWEAPVSITRAVDGQDGNVVDILIDPFGYVHFCYSLTNNAWDGADWQPRGDSLRFTREVEGGFSDPAILLGYLNQRYIMDLDMVIDRNGGNQIIFATVMYDGVNFWDYNVNYTTSAPTGDPEAFIPAEKIRPDTNSNLDWLIISAFADGGILASWFESEFGAGTPTVGRMCSRYNDGAGWSDTVTVSDVPDLVHFSAAGWPSYVDVCRTDTGEQQAVFETAKYNNIAATYYDFNKHFAQTVNGEWTAPELISGLEAAGAYPSIHSDDNQRLFVLYDVEDAATGKDVVYATMQRDPTPPATTYYFAEGTTRQGFEEWISIQNSGEEDANVTITYMLETGENIDGTLVVPAHARSTVNVNTAVGEDHDVSARLTADRLIVAERPMYFDYYGWPGGHCCVGALNTSRVWFFAEGTTRSGFAEYLTLQNPSDNDTLVDITYILDDGTTLLGQVEVPARTRATVNVNQEVGEGRDVSMVVRSPEVAIVAERPMYFDYHGWAGGHCVVGSTSLANRWYFAEGTTREGFDTYICLQNPYDVDAVANLTFILGDGSTVVQPMSVPATSRQTLRVNDAIGSGQDVSSVVESDSLLLAERPMYFLYHGAWDGGHVATGALNPKNSWYFAEGTTRNGFEEWLSLQNPGDINTIATLSFMLEDGTVEDVEVGVPAHTRVTVNVPAAVGTGHDVSVAIWSPWAIVAERPMYFLYHGAWAGGHDVIGL
ncbi:MAG: hypothetical protein SWK76_14235 [Actinomycetota bacterium]|nr:hypothetical protein [Actinomycetota bacterium]